MTRTAQCAKLLHLASQNRIEEFCCFVAALDYEIKWNEVIYEKSGDTVMHVAARNGSLNILKFLFETKRCEFEVVNLDGKRPLHEAAQAGQTECVHYLLSQSVVVDPLKRADWTPLMLACTKDNLIVIQHLLDAGANPKLLNKDGWNSFHIACREGYETVIKHFLKVVPGIWQTTSRNGRTPLHTAAFHGHTHVVDILLQESLASLNSKDKCGSTPLMDASRFEHIGTMMLLLEKYHADLCAVDILGQNCLHLAAQANGLKSIVYLVKTIGMELDARTSAGQTSLHLAAKEGHAQCIELLMTLGANPNITDDNNRSAALIAQLSGFQDCFRLLIQTQV